jgi:transcriptional regulator with XRE-family HTH domain
MKQLTRLRKLKGYSQRALAAESGVSPATIYELENGRREPNPSTLRKLARGLGVEVADLLEEVASLKDRDQKPLQEVTVELKVEWRVEANEHLNALDGIVENLPQNPAHEAREHLERVRELIAVGAGDAA